MDDEWQEVPDEWLDPAEGSSPPPESSDEQGKKHSNGKAKTGLEDDYDEGASDLTELSDHEEGPGPASDAEPPFDEARRIGEVKEEESEKLDAEAPPAAPAIAPREDPGFVEWETVRGLIDQPRT